MKEEEILILTTIRNIISNVMECEIDKHCKERPYAYGKIMFALLAKKYIPKITDINIAKFINIDRCGIVQYRKKYEEIKRYEDFSVPYLQSMYLCDQKFCDNSTLFHSSIRELIREICSVKDLKKIISLCESHIAKLKTKYDSKET